MNDRLDNYRMRPRPRRRPTVDDGMEHGMPSPYFGMGPRANSRERSIDEMKRDMYHPFSGMHTRRLAVGGRLGPNIWDGGPPAQELAQGARRDVGAGVPSPWQYLEPAPRNNERSLESLVLRPNEFTYDDAVNAPDRTNEYPYGFRRGGRMRMTTMDPEGNVRPRRMPRFEDGGRLPEVDDSYQASYDPRAAAMMSPELWPELSNAAGRAHRQTFQDRLPRTETIPAAEGNSPPIQGVWPEGSRTEGPNTPIWRAPPMWPAAKGPYTPMQRNAGPYVAPPGGREATPAASDGHSPTFDRLGITPSPWSPLSWLSSGQSMKDYYWTNPVTKAITSVIPEDDPARPRSPHIRPLVSFAHDAAAITSPGFWATLPSHLDGMVREVNRGEYGEAGKDALGGLAAYGVRAGLGRFSSPAFNATSNALFGSRTPFAGVHGYGGTKDPFWRRPLADLSEQRYQVKWPGELNVNHASPWESANYWLSNNNWQRWLSPKEKHALDLVEYKDGIPKVIGKVEAGYGPNSSIDLYKIDPFQTRTKLKKGEKAQPTSVTPQMMEEVANSLGNAFRYQHKLHGRTNVDTPSGPVPVPSRVYNAPVMPPVSAAPPTIRDPRANPLERLNEAFPAAPIPQMRVTPTPTPPAAPARSAADDAAWRKAISTFGGEAYVPDRVRQLLGRQYGGRINYASGGNVDPYRTMRPIRRPTTGWSALPRSNMIDDRRNEFRHDDNFLKIQDRMIQGDTMGYPESGRGYANGGRVLPPVGSVVVMPTAFWEE